MAGLVSSALVWKVEASNAQARSLRRGGGGGADGEDGLQLTLVLIITFTTIPFVLSVCVGLWRYRRQLVAIFPEVPVPTNEKVTNEDRRNYWLEEQKKRSQEVEPPEPTKVQKLAPGDGPLLDVHAIFQTGDDPSDDDSNSLFGSTLGSQGAFFTSEAWMPVSRMRSMSEGDLRRTAHDDNFVEQMLSKSQPLAPRVFVRPPSDIPLDSTGSKKRGTRASSKGSAGTQGSKGSKASRKLRSSSKGSSHSKGSARSKGSALGLDLLGEAKPQPRPRLQTN